MKHLFTLKMFLIACISMLLGGGNAVAQTQTVSMDFEGETFPGNTDWSVTTFTEYASLSHNVGSKSASSAGKTSGNVTYTKPLTNVSNVTFYISKTSKNTNTSSYYVVEGSEDNVLWTELGKSVTFDKVTQNEWTETSIEINNFNGYIRVSYSGTAAVRLLDDITITYSEGEALPKLEGLTISPADGTTFETTQDVTITCPEGATIYYTTNGDAPTTESTSSTSDVTLTLDATTTVKVLAKKDGYNDATTSATFTKIIVLTGIAGVKEIVTSTTATDFEANWEDVIVTGVNGSNVYLQDASAGILMYLSGHGLTAGDKISGRVSGTAKLYNGVREITALDLTSATKVSGATVPAPIELTVAGILDNYEMYEGMLVVVKDATVSEAFTNLNGTITQDGKELTVRAADNNIAMAVQNTVDIKGYVGKYNTTIQLNVLAQEDITIKTAVPVFYFSTDAVSVRVDGEVTEPTLENTYDETPVYSSSNIEVATVNAETGEVTIVAEGESTITAKLVGAGKEASYTLTVTGLPVKKDGYYYLVTSVDELEVGARYLIVCKTKATVLAKQSDNTNFRTSVAATIEEDGELSVIKGLPEGAREVVLEHGTTNTLWSFYVVEENTYLALNEDNNYLQTGIHGLKNSSASIGISEGNAEIVFQSYTGRNLRYNASSPRFACYTTAQTAIQLYKLYTEFAIGTDGYASFYTDKAFVMPEGVEGGIVTAANEGKLTIEYNYAAGATVPAGTALLLKGAAGKYAYNLAVSEEAAPKNLLHGAECVDGDGMMSVEGENVKYYILSKDKNGENLGFYWAAAEGAAVKYQAGKAFLAIDAAAGVNAFSMFSLDGEATGIESTEAANAGDGKVYTLTGVCVGNNVKALPKGIYIVNGKKVAF